MTEIVKTLMAKASIVKTTVEKTTVAKVKVFAFALAFTVSAAATTPAATVAVSAVAVAILASATVALAAGHGSEGGGGGEGEAAPSGGGEGANVRWTLLGWMQEKQQFKMQDQWLAMHRTEGHYELDLAGGSQSYKYTTNVSSTGAATSNTTTSETGSRFLASFFYSIFGVSYEHESSSENWVRQSGEVKLRLFGTHARSSFLNMGVGERTWAFSSPTSTVTNAFAHAKLNIYLVHFFGLTGDYSQYFKASDGSGASYDGSKLVYGAFVEIGFLRLGGTAFTEITHKTPTATAASSDTRSGSELELAFFF